MAKFLRVVALLMLLRIDIGITEGALIRQSVVFQKRNEISLTQSQWLASFIIDLKPFDEFLVKLQSDIETVQSEVTGILDKYVQPKHLQYQNTFGALNKEIDFLKELRYGLAIQVNDYRHISKNKRSVLPFVGDALSFLFGTVSESDLDHINDNVNRLARTQNEVIHIVEQSLSILNASRLEIKENRQSIIELTDAIQTLDTKVDEIKDALGQEIFETRYFLDLYLRFNLLTDEIKEMLQGALFYMENLKTQINLLSLGTVAPSLIMPRNLRALLLDIKAHLPRQLSLMGDPSKDIWVFYRHLTSDAVLTENQIVVLMTIPLIQINNMYEVWSATSLPVPLYSSGEMTTNTPSMLAVFELESSGLLVDKSRTQFAILPTSELTACSDQSITFCKTSSPLYEINMSHFCIVNLFIENNRDFCKVNVMMNGILPKALALENFSWAIATVEKMQFSIVCERGETFSLLAEPPLAILTLKPNCIGANKYLTLMAGNTMRGSFALTEDHLFLRQINITATNIWKPVQEKKWNFSKIDLPKELQPIREIPMDDLVDRLSRAQYSESDGLGNVTDDFLTRIYTISTGAVVIAIILMFLSRKYFLKLLCFVKSWVWSGTPAGASDQRHVQTAIELAPPIAPPVVETSGTASASASEKMIYPTLRVLTTQARAAEDV